MSNIQKAKQCITHSTNRARFFCGPGQVLSKAARLIFIGLFAALVTISGQVRADLIIVNGDVRTLDPAKPKAEAVAAAGSKIIAVGTTREIRLLAGERTRVIDAGGRLVIPGFNDSHVHFAAIGNKFSSIDLKNIRSPEDMAAKLGEYAQFLPKGRWILGGGFDPSAMGGGTLRELADAVTPENPVFVYSADGKSAFLNAAAESRVPGAAKPPGGDGIISGTAIRLAASAVPAGHLSDWPEVLQTASNYAASLGVTSVQDMHSDELADVYRELDRAGKLKTRVYDCSPLSARAKLSAQGVKAASGDAMVRTGCLKYFSEGAASEIPYLKREIAAADKAGLQVMIHAIGPRANRIVLDAFEWAAKRNGPRDRRFRVEHAHNAFPGDVPRLARKAIIPSMQPWLFRGSGPAVFGRHLKLGSALAFGSDAPMLELDPLLGIYAAVSGPDGITVEEAVRAYTTGAAFAEFQEKVKGSISRGKLADIVILSDNILAHGVLRDRSVVAVVTIVNGKIVYQRGRPEDAMP